METSISTLLTSAEQGSRAAADALFTTLYGELHRMARRELVKRGNGMTLGATTLLHEAYLDISGRERAAFPDRSRFMAYASRVMRGLIIDYARARRAQKRGGLFELTAMSTDIAESVADGAELSRILHELADRLTWQVPTNANIRDANGNTCGRAWATRDKIRRRPATWEG